MSIFTISGESMSPTFKNGDLVVLEKANSITKDQIIFFNKPSNWTNYSYNNDYIVVKRVKAIPGDTLTFSNNTLKVNNEIIYTIKNDKDCKNPPKTYETTLNENQIFVMGDNIDDSYDSKYEFCNGNHEEMFLTNENIIDYGKILLNI